MEGLIQYAPALFTVLSSAFGQAGNNAKYAAQQQAAQQDVVNAQFMQKQYDSNANSEEAAGQRANLDMVHRGQFVASSFDAGAAASGTFGPDMAVNRARIMTEAAYQGGSKQWSYDQAARNMRLQGESAVWSANNKLNQVNSAGGAVGMANMGLVASAGASLFQKYGGGMGGASGGGMTSYDSVIQ